jgi:hypothetical protein
VGPCLGIFLCINRGLGHVRKEALSFDGLVHKLDLCDQKSM